MHKYLEALHVDTFTATIPELERMRTSAQEFLAELWKAWESLHFPKLCLSPLRSGSVSELSMADLVLDVQRGNVAILKSAMETTVQTCTKEIARRKSAEVVAGLAAVALMTDEEKLDQLAHDHGFQAVQ